MADVRPMIRWHHECCDGSGYPDALSAADVPVEAWIVKAADYWEAITSRRPYREPMSIEQAVRTLRAEAGVRIPAEIVETFLDAIAGAPVALPVTSS
jgi:HD-GYP domain-containing protein (c-di-GMP phosphodiesterase class II)